MVNNNKTTFAVRSKKKALFCLVLGTITIGLAPILVRLSPVGAISTGFWRVAIVFPFLALRSFSQGAIYASDTEIPSFKDYLWVLLAGILFGGSLASWYLSLQRTTIANATLLVNFSPVLMALWGWLVLHKPLQKKLVLGLLFAITGIAILIKPNLHMAGHTATAYALALSTAFFYTGYLLIFNRSCKKFTALGSMTIANFSSMLTLLVISFFSSASFLPHTGLDWIILIEFALFLRLGPGCIACALPYLPVTFSVIAVLVSTMIAAIAGWVFFAEYLSLLQISGFLIALVGIYLAKQTT